ncbi:MAG: excinuclease ABC subunit UvrC [Clostridia bacterium]|nr:excinuclease ABC subunit UvrC [Clostridia bacterium]
MDIKQLRDKAMHLPLKPGVYIMKNTRNEIIYIGKAKALKNRVSQYFGSDKNHPEKVRRMVENVDHFDYIICGSEFEALVLECSLIKQHKPKYNILLKDDKGYSYIRISKPPWRKISFEMQKSGDGADYLGPYMSAWYAKNAVDEALKIFRLPSCGKTFPRDIGKSRPCLNYYIKQCSAPCSGKISQKDYDECVDAAVMFLKSGDSDSIRQMTERMNEAAENLEFELAARLRDRISAVKKITEKQNVVAANVKEQDAISVMTEGEEACFAVIRFSQGRLYDKEDFLIRNIGADPDLPSMRSEFIQQYYSMRDNIPPVIALDGEAEDEQLLSQWLSEKKGRSVRLTHPQKGENMRIIEMSRENAAERLAQSHGHLGHELTALDELAKLLGLPKAPRFIESYDISHHAGSDNVAGMVVFKDGRPYKKSYRRFEIKGFVGQDDYGSMNEVIRRRFKEYFKNPDSGIGFGQLPDLILLDGGKGQVSAVRPVLEEFGLDIPLFGMVKDNHHRTRAITDEGHEIAINSKRRAFTLVSGIQDEVHRFAITYHRQKHSKRSFATSLTEIEGIGPTRAKALMTTFKTIGRIKEAEVEELLQVKGMTLPAAEAVYHYYRKDKNTDEE